MIVLRDYQQKAIDDIRSFFQSGGKHCILQAPTGSGKTVIFTELARLVNEKGKKVLIMTDRAELLLQAGGSMRKAGIVPMYIQAGQQYINNSFMAFIAMSQTLRRRIDMQYWQVFLSTIDLLIIDECHKQEFNYILESGIFDNKHVIGFTATPKRSGGMRQLALDYEKIIFSTDVKDLIKDGYLVNDDYYGVFDPDMTGVGIDNKKGDYKTGAMFQKFNDVKLYSGAVENYRKIADNSKTIVFCVNIEHCVRTAMEFHEAGYPVKFITSKLNRPNPPKDPGDKGKVAVYEERLRVFNLYNDNIHLTGSRSEVFKGFDKNEFTILVNAGIATTGFDQADIATVIVLRATLSLTLWLQMLGRGSRPYPNKTHFNILDFGGNSKKHGFYTEERLWNLWHDKVNSGGVPPIKSCGYDSKGKPIIVDNKKGCRRPILASYKICPFCGFKYPEKKSKKKVELQAIYMDMNGHIKTKKKRFKDMTYKELSDYREAKSHKMAWLWRQLWYKGGPEAIREFGAIHGWKEGTIMRAIHFMKR